MAKRMKPGNKTPSAPKKTHRGKGGAPSVPKETNTKDLLKRLGPYAYVPGAKPPKRKTKKGYK